VNGVRPVRSLASATGQRRNQVKYQYNETIHHVKAQGLTQAFDVGLTKTWYWLLQDVPKISYSSTSLVIPLVARLFHFFDI
jgi:hypothetical protein